MYIKLILWSEVYKRNMSHHPWKDHTVHVNFSNEHVNVDFKVAQDQPFLKVKVHCEHVAKAAPLRPPVVFGPALFNDSDSYQPDSSENLGTTTEEYELDDLATIEVPEDASEEYQEIEVEEGY